MNRGGREPVILRWRETNPLEKTPPGSLSRSTTGGQVQQSPYVQMSRYRDDLQPFASRGGRSGNAQELVVNVRVQSRDPAGLAAGRHDGHARPYHAVRRPVGDSRNVIRCYSELTY